MASKPPTHFDRTRKKPKKKAVIIAIVALAGSCLLCIGGVSFFGVGPYDLPSQSRKLDEIVAESQRLGLPMTQDELVPPSDLSYNDNALTEVYRLALEIERHDAESELVLSLPGTPERALLVKDVIAVQPYLEGIVEELEAVKDWRLEKDYDLGPHVLFPEYATLKGVAKYLSARTVIKGERGDVEGALRDLRAGRKLSKNLSSDPTLISMLVAIAIDAIMLRASEHLVTAWADDAESLSALEKTLQRTEHRVDPRQALRGEFYMSLTTARNLKAFGGIEGLTGAFSEGDYSPPDPREIKRTGLPEGMFARASFASIAESWNEVFRSFEGVKEPPRNWSAKLDEIDQRMEENFRFSQVLAMIMLPIFSQADASLSANDADHDMNLALVRVMKYRAENGHLPDSLAEVNAAFADPFSEKNELSVILSEDEVRIWSISRNRVDDGGLPKTSTYKDRDDRAVFWPAAKREEAMDN